MAEERKCENPGCNNILSGKQKKFCCNKCRYKYNNKNKQNKKNDRINILDKNLINLNNKIEEEFFKLHRRINEAGKAFYKQQRQINKLQEQINRISNVVEYYNKKDERDDDIPF